MTFNLKNLIFTLFFIGSFFNAFANQYPLVKKKLRCPPDKNREMTPGYNETGRIQVRGSWDLFITGTFIYWQPIEENLDLAYSSLSFDTPQMTKEYYKMKFKWGPGLKISAGIISDHDDWIISADYTWLHTKNKSAYSGSNENIIPYTLTDTSNIYNFFAVWYLDLDLINLQVGRPMYLGKKLIAQPYAALALAFIKQRYYFNTHAKKGDFIYQPYSRDRTDSWGLGPKVGLTTTWKLTDHLGCIANISGEILYTCYRIRNKSFNLYKESSMHDLYSKVDRKFIRPVAELATGFSWEAYIGEDFWHLEISALYELHIFWHHNMLSAESKGDDLYLNGLTMSAKIDF